MKKICLFLVTVYMTMAVIGQNPGFGFGQPQTAADWTDVSYVNDDQVYHKLDIYLPQNGKEYHQAVIIIYGSAWFANNMKQMAFLSLGKPLLESGFAVVSINHRSSSDAAYPAQIQDVKAAIRFIRANANKYHIDNSFIGITGFSSGGHLSALAGVTNGLKNYTIGNTNIDIEGELGDYTAFSSDVDAVVDWFGPIDFAHFADNCTKPKGQDSPEGALIKCNPEENPEMVALVSPTTYIDKSDPHFLVIHGQADNVVAHCQSEIFATALQQENLLDEFISVPEGQHGPVTFNDSTFRKMCLFFHKEAEQ